MGDRPIRFSADLYNVAWPFVSKDVARRYFTGVLVEPHPKSGVLLVATDGHALICIHDLSGSAEKQAIIKLEPDRARNLASGSSIVVDDGSATIEHDGQPLNLFDDADLEIDGEFPNWRRAIPQHGDPVGGSIVAPHLLARMAHVGESLDAKAMQIVFAEKDGPGLVLWRSVDHAFGVVMPMGWDKTFELPAFWRDDLKARWA